MVGARVAGRVVVSMLLLPVLAGSGVGPADEPSEAHSAASAVTLTRPPGLTVDAAPSGRTDVLSGTWAEQRSPKARLRLGLAVLVGFSLLLAAGIVALTRPSSVPSNSVCRRWSAVLRAPPVLRFS